MQQKKVLQEPEIIVQRVLTIFEIPSLLVKSQKLNITDARIACSFLLRKHTNLLLRQIGSIVGVTHHTTVMYHCKKAKTLCEVDKLYSIKVNTIINEIISLNTVEEKVEIVLKYVTP